MKNIILSYKDSITERNITFDSIGYLQMVTTVK
jgi:hypothetical protein